MKNSTYQQAFLQALYDDIAQPEFVTQDTSHRFSAYTIGLRARFEESLREAFPATERLLGHAVFHRYSRQYVETHPSTTWDLSRVGEAWPAFLSAHPELQAHTYVGELARFEWLLHTLFFMADRDAPGGFPDSPDTLDSWRPQFSTTLTVFISGWAVADLHQLTESGEHAIVPKPSAYLVFRDQAGFVRYLTLTTSQAALQGTLFKGASLGEAVAATAGLGETDIGLLASAWTTHGLLRT